MRTNPDTSADTLPTLGAPIKPAAKPAAAPVPVAPGVVRGADGRLATNAPPPTPIWTAPLVPAGVPDDASTQAALIVSTLTPEELLGIADAQAAISEWLEF